MAAREVLNVGIELFGSESYIRMPQDGKRERSPQWCRGSSAKSAITLTKTASPRLRGIKIASHHTPDGALNYIGGAEETLAVTLSANGQCSSQAKNERRLRSHCDNE